MAGGGPGFELRHHHCTTTLNSRAHFADDIAAELTESAEDAEPFVAELAELSIACMKFTYAAIGAYTDSKPDGTFEAVND